MSILSQLLQGKISLAQAFGEAEAWLGQAETSIEKSVVGDPGVQAALNTVIADGKAAISVGADWAGTAIAGGLASFAADLATLVGRYVPSLIGPAGGPLAAAGVTAIQALGEVGVAAIQHEVATLVTGSAAAVAAVAPHPAGS
jgi:hypothetical protein